MRSPANSTFVVNREDLHQCHLLDQPLLIGEDLAEGEVLLLIDCFSFTANNISYAALGNAFRYWDFFPAEAPWGQIPVWGFADVVASRHPEVAVGTRVYGYLPMARQLKVQPRQVKKGGFVDGAPHRQALALIYNQYQFTASDPAYRPEHEALQMLLRPLLTTAFLLDDFLAGEDFFGADQVILTSASSKTALGLAFMLRHQRQNESRAKPLIIIGLTSAGNRDFVEGLGYYDQVVSYDAIEELDAGRASVSVDFAGNGAVLARLHQHFQEQLRFSSLVGASHWDQSRGKQSLPGPAPVLFFAPTYWEKAVQQSGSQALMHRFAALWAPLVDSVEEWMMITLMSGPEAVSEAYQETLAGRVTPDQGLVLSLQAP